MCCAYIMYGVLIFTVVTNNDIRRPLLENFCQKRIVRENNNTSTKPAISSFGDTRNINQAFTLQLLAVPFVISKLISLIDYALREG